MVSVNRDIDKSSNIGQLVSTKHSVNNIYLDKERNLELWKTLPIGAYFEMEKEFGEGGDLFPGFTLVINKLLNGEEYKNETGKSPFDNEVNGTDPQNQLPDGSFENCTFNVDCNLINNPTFFGGFENDGVMKTFNALFPGAQAWSTAHDFYLSNENPTNRPYGSDKVKTIPIFFIMGTYTGIYGTIHKGVVNPTINIVDKLKKKD
jgi:hypothetical protein